MIGDYLALADLQKGVFGPAAIAEEQCTQRSRQSLLAGRLYMSAAMLSAAPLEACQYAFL